MTATVKLVNCQKGAQHRKEREYLFMKRVFSMLLALTLLISCVSLAAAEEKKSLTVWIPQYQFSKAEDAILFDFDSCV